MNIAQAMKKKSRLLRDLLKTQQNILQYNSVVVGANIPVDVEKEMDKQQLLKDELISLKLKIFEASRPMREHIVLLSELKDSLTFYTSINTEEGKVMEGYSDTIVDKECVFNYQAVQEKITEIQSQIDQTQDELDAFNHKTEID